jgi:hypothetical protein
MLPEPLQFELLPRRSLRAWRLVLHALLLAVAAGAAAMWFARQSELAETRAQIAQARAAIAAHTPPAPQGALVLSPQEAQDLALGEWTVEPRLLEIERCTDATTIVSRFSHDEAAKVTTVELDFNAPDRLAVLLACLNTAPRQEPAWKLASVQAMPGGQGGESGAQRATLRR